jgi:hypothetical protein
VVKIFADLFDKILRHFLIEITLRGLIKKNFRIVRGVLDAKVHCVMIAIGFPAHGACGERGSNCKREDYEGNNC